MEIIATKRGKTRKFVSVIVLLSCLIWHTTFANNWDILSSWQNLDTKSSKLTTDAYKTIKSTVSVPTPYTWALLLDSKYDQSNPNKDTLIKPSPESAKIQANIKSFWSGLIKYFKAYKDASSTSKANKALADFDKYMNVWAEANALTNPDASSTGIAARKWALAQISGTLMNISKYSNWKYEPSELHKTWLRNLANQVINDYEPRRLSSFSGYHNNHDYWASWSVMITSMILNDSEMFDWSFTWLKMWINQLVIPSWKSYAYWPYEVARWTLAADYSNYALVPIMFLADWAVVNNKTLTTTEQKKLAYATNFAAMSIMNPSSLSEISSNQQSVEKYKFVWVIPFLKHAPTQYQTKARQLYNTYKSSIDNYSQIWWPINHYYNVN